MGELLPGQLGSTFLVAILDAAVLSWLALLWYGRSVRRLMMRGTPVAGTPEASPPPLPAPDAGAPAHLTFAVYDDTSAPGRAAADIRLAPPPRVVLAYCLGAAAFSSVITFALWQMPSNGDITMLGWLSIWWIRLWPIVPTLVALAALDRRGAVRTVAIYLGAGAALLMLATLISQVVRGALSLSVITNVYYLVLGAIVTASAPLLLILLTGWRRVRAVMPLTLAATLCFGLGLILFTEGMMRASNRAAFLDVLLDLSVYTGAQAAYFSLFFLLALPIGWVAWRILTRVGRAYEAKRFSNVQLVIDCWWLVAVCEVTVTDLAGAYGVASLAIGVAAFIAYRAAVSLAIGRRPLADAHTGERLLLLRVFGYQSRTEQLFDGIAERWRFRGPVQLIAAPDLATRTVDPGEMLTFLRGRLRDQYIDGVEQVPLRMAGIDRERDPDGRYRVTELFCRDDTWQPALTALLRDSDLALMDLRGFSPRNAGCIYELEQLMATLPSDRVALLWDHTTDLRLLGTTLDAAWAAACTAGRARGNGQLALVRVGARHRPALSQILTRLSGSGAPSRLVDAAQLAH